MVVVGHGKDEVIAQFGHDKRISWVEQTEQLGTGHAARMCEPHLKDFHGDVIILAGDGPLITDRVLKTLVNAGIREIMIVSGKGHAGHFLELLGSGLEFGISLSYEIQKEAGGIAQALSLAEQFSEGGSLAVVLGDNIFEDIVSKYVRTFRSGARTFLKKVPDAHRFGVAEIDESHGRVLGIEEKPRHPKSDYAVTGLYLYDHDVFDIARKLKPSGRGELEITDVNNEYIRRGTMSYSVLNGHWTDAGTFESLFRASEIARAIKDKKYGYAGNVRPEAQEIKRRVKLASNPSAN
jgi:glucose-1-phosphate thymidylyltransferase